ncbi:hypothetical protein NU195Hw_Modified_231t1 [Hortaea werneckii]
MPSLRRERHDDLIVTEGRDGIERVYREVTGRHRRRSSRTSRHSASSSGTPISSEDSLSVSSPSRYSTVEVKPAAVSPRIRSWDPPQHDRTPDRRANEGHRPLTPEEKTIFDFAPSQKHPRVATDERINPPNNSERNHRTSNLNLTSSPQSPLQVDTNPLRPSLKPQTQLQIPSPITSPIIASPGLSNLPPLRHRRDDSAKGFVFSKESSPGKSAQSDRSSSRRSGAGEQHVRFEEDVAVGRKDREGGSRAWSQRSGEHGSRYRGRDNDSSDRRRQGVRVEEGYTQHWELAPESFIAGSTDQGDVDEGEGSVERRDRHRRRAADALDGKRKGVREESDQTESRTIVRECPAGGIFEPEEETAERNGLKISRSSLQTAERSPIALSSTPKSSTSSTETSRPTRKVTIHQYRYGEPGESVR